MSELKTLSTIDTSPFKRLVLNLGAAPTDFTDGMTYYELLAWLVKFLNDEVVPKTNESIEGLKELQTYVSTYFDNLDVQEEINNKLDEMAEDGQLTDIIAQYLQLAGVLAFNTVADMQAGENLVNGSVAKTLGKNTYLDGDGRFYKIRNITNDDTIDGVNIIAITADTTNTLIAELIPEDYLTNISNLQTLTSTLDSNSLTELIVIGDSYTAFSNSTWAEDVASQLHLNLHKNAQSSAGFAHAVNGNTFNTLLGTESQAIRLKTKYVICYGGINDYDQTYANIRDAVSTFCVNAKQYYPNAQIIIVGPQTAANQFNREVLDDITKAMNIACITNGVSWSDAKDWLWNNTNMTYNQTYDTDKLHPTALGYKIITAKMLRLINGNPESFSNPVLTPYTGVTYRITTNNSRHGDIFHINARIGNLVANNGVYTELFSFVSDLVNFMPLTEGIIPVYKLSSDSDTAYATDVLGYCCFSSDGTKLRMVNTSGSDYSGPALVKGDLHIGGIKKEYNIS